MARGGSRTPANPAPVSPPGALSRRTDGGASQPIRLAPGGQYGDRQKLEQAQQGAPLSAGAPTPPVGRTAPPTAPSPPGQPEGIFGPTQRPQEAPNAGLQQEPGVLPPDPDALIRILYSMYPHPDLARLLGENSGP